MKGMIGLEIHTYIKTQQKLFCECQASRVKGLKPNTNICPICTGQPGAKPMAPNLEAIKKAIQIGLILGCKINQKMDWQRKHYNWPDLPKGYQNTLSGTYATPLGVKGKFQKINISSMHLEEDPASWDPQTGCIDYNRSGLPLVEIVTAPEFAFADEVIEWLNSLLHSLAYLKSVDTDAGIKVDVNVNIPGKTERVEIKNLNSLESIKKAIDFELERQLREGSRRETRRYDEAKGKTIPMRTKEQAEDYRFISDPDLQPIILENALIKTLQDSLPESPEEKLSKLIKKFKIPVKDADILAKNIDIVEFFEKVAQKIPAQFALPWVTIELLRVLNYNKTTLDKTQIQPEHFISLLELVKDKKITPLQAKTILNKFYPKSFSPQDVQNKITDLKELEPIIKQVIKENPQAVKDFKAGEKSALNFLLGKVMQKTAKRADYKISQEILLKLLK